jgi:hypothetical protein
MDECNGLANLCAMPVNEILYGMVHNAMSSPSAGFVFFANHLNDPIIESLDAGYRGLSLDLCNCNGNLEFCHGGDGVGCGVGRRDPIDTFGEINDWIAQNPNNVLLIYLEINEDAGGDISLDDVNNIVQGVPNGFANRLYQHDSESASWPALKQLIENEQQVIFFYIRGPNGNGVQPPGIHFYHDIGWENDWSYENVEELEDRTLGSCTITRGEQSDGEFLMINAFVTRKNLFGVQFQPSQDAAEEINTVEFMEPLIEACEGFHGTNVNIIAVDFWATGTLIALVEQHNAVLLAPPTPSLVPQTPTFSTTKSPTATPIAPPTATPTARPTKGPSPSPTTPKPSTALATSLPTPLDIPLPSLGPATEPPSIGPTTRILSSMPPLRPNGSPSSLPTIAPTASPTLAPSLAPTVSPTLAPSLAPTVSPTLAPSLAPTVSPTLAPSLAPSWTTTTTPSTIPSSLPTDQSSRSPSDAPTAASSSVPSTTKTDPTSTEPDEGSSSCSRSYDGMISATVGLSAFLTLSLLWF